MYSPTVLKQLEKFARQDMAMARKEGAIVIAGTKKGNVDLAYWPSTQNYSLASEGEILYGGKAKGCREAIIGLYVVV